MNKVSWPTRHELFRASVVVLFTIFVLAVLYFSAFDMVFVGNDSARSGVSGVPDLSRNSCRDRLN